MLKNPLENVCGRKLNILITIASTSGFLLFGYDNGIFSGLIINPWFLKTFNHPSASILGITSAIYNIGGAIGAIFSFFFGGLLGRRPMILAGVAVLVIGTIPFSAATNIAQLLAGRIVCGIGVGIMSSTVGMWQAETAPARSRGAYLVAQLCFGAAVGLFLAQWINFGFYGHPGRVSFAFPVAFQLVFVLVGGTLTLMLPESPRWLAKNGKTEEALRILARLYGAEDAEQHLEDIATAVRIEHSAGGNSFTALFKQGHARNLTRLTLACGVMVMHQTNGINSMTYYFPTLLRTFLHADRRMALWIGGLSSVESIVFCAVTVLTVDRFGRRVFLIGGGALQAVLLAVLAALLATAPEGDRVFGIAATVMLFLFYGINAACWLGVSWAYPAEILPLGIREKGLGLGNVFYWLLQFLFVEVTPIALENIFYNFIIILAVLNACSALVIWLFYPETARKSLEELDEIFAHKDERELSGEMQSSYSEKG